MKKGDEVRQAFAELMENLGVIGLFMLKEIRTLLRSSWGTNKEEFMRAVDKTAKTMKHSGKWAIEDIERTAERIRQSWDLFDKQKNQDWDKFLNEIKTRLNTMGEITKDTFNLAINQAKQALDKQWTAVGRLGEEQLKAIRKESDRMAKAFQEQWSVFHETLQKTGKKIDRAVQAAWEELKKKE